MSATAIGDFGKKALLTGAGFSKNWGGRLASEVWADVFSNRVVQARDRVRSALLRERSFEAVMHEVLTNDAYDMEDRHAIIEAVTRSFREMDDLYAQKTIISADRTINYGSLKTLLEKFRRTSGYLFTLNQDRLIEMLLENRNISYQTPCVPRGTRKISDERPTSLLSDYSTSFNVVKLHGCHTWATAQGFPVMVLGDQKEKQIAGSWLLTDYAGLFADVLNSGGVHLLIIGYSFRDAHINRIISSAVSQHQCKVFVWNPAHPLDALKDPLAGKEAMAIVDGLIGWEPRSLADTMPAVRTLQIADDQVLSEFFAL